MKDSETMQHNLTMNIILNFLKADVLLGYFSTILLFAFSLSEVQTIITVLGMLVGIGVSIFAILRGYNEYQISKIELQLKQKEMEELNKKNTDHDSSDR
jgi:hypothetical protein